MAIFITVAVIILFIMMVTRKRRRGLYGPRYRPQMNGSRAVSREVKALVWRRDGGRCRHCGITDSEAVARSGAHLHYDHIVPYSRGGMSNTDNIQLLCESCNLSKGNRYIG
jgi:5-methylcytosine-specific restriction endonuclease McrA